MVAEGSDRQDGILTNEERVYLVDRARMILNALSDEELRQELNKREEEAKVRQYRKDRAAYHNAPLLEQIDNLKQQISLLQTQLMDED
jgi:hypothetical protein